MGFPSAPPDLPGVTHSDVVIDRARWHVAQAGDGPPIVLLHGWPQHWWIWRHVIGALAPDHRVIAPDLRGFGWSEAPPGRYSKMGLAADVERLLDVLEIDRCVLVGHDWGGFVAWLTAIRAPERIERLVPLSIPHPWLRLGFDPRATLATVYQPLLAAPGLGTAVLRRTPLIRLMLRMGVGPGFAWTPRDLALYADAFKRPEHARASSAVYRTFLTSELGAILRGRYANRRLEMPVTMATGEHDPVCTPARLEGADGRVPDPRVHVVEGAGHFLPEEAPDRVLELIRLKVA
jgi:pimeloyl-ACP methyl ester carboxylesterase